MLGYSKKDLLLFRKLHVMGLNRQLAEATGHESLVADCEFLAEAGYMLEAPEHPRSLGLYALNKLEEPHARLSVTDKRYPVRYFTSGLRHPSSDGLAFPLGGEVAVAYVITSSGELSVPVLDAPLEIEDWRTLQREILLPDQAIQQDGHEAIVEVVLNNLPTPGEDVPLAAILDFSSDEETRRKLAGLDIWMRRQAHSGKELQEVALEMEESLHDLANHMRLADMRSQTSGFRMIMAIPLGIIEELLHLKPRGAMDVVFEYRDRKANRLEAELSAPGGALAYIYAAEKRFG